MAYQAIRNSAFPRFMELNVIFPLRHALYLLYSPSSTGQADGIKNATVPASVNSNQAG
jgi:hypothetical protein